jgi:hypothetical protein
MGVSITPFIAIETLIAQCKNVTGAREWGQKAAIISPAVGTLHWLYIQFKHIRGKRGRGIQVSKIIKALRQADQLRADPQLKQIFEGLFNTFKVDHKDALERVISLSKKALARSLSDPTNGPIPVMQAIKGGAPLTSKDPDYYPLCMAVNNGDLETVKALLAPRRLDLGNEPMYSTPMVLAATTPCRFEDLKECADVNEEITPPVTLISFDKEPLRSRMGQTPIIALTLAVIRGDSAIVEHLLKGEEVDVNAQRGLALYLAMHYFNRYQVAEPHRAEVLKLLLEHKDIDVETDRSDFSESAHTLCYQSPLVYAMFLGNKELISQFLNRKPPTDVNRTQGTEGSALDIAERLVLLKVGRTHSITDRHGEKEVFRIGKKLSR